MDSLLKFFKKKNIQQLLGFLVSLLLLWIIAYPLVSESSTINRKQIRTKQIQIRIVAIRLLKHLQ